MLQKVKLKIERWKLKIKDEIKYKIIIVRIFQLSVFNFQLANRVACIIRKLKKNILCKAPIS